MCSPVAVFRIVVTGFPFSSACFSSTIPSSAAMSLSRSPSRTRWIISPMSRASRASSSFFCSSASIFAHPLSRFSQVVIDRVAAEQDFPSLAPRERKPLGVSIQVICADVHSYRGLLHVEQAILVLDRRACEAGLCHSGNFCKLADQPGQFRRRQRLGQS